MPNFEMNTSKDNHHINDRTNLVLDQGQSIISLSKPKTDGKKKKRLLHYKGEILTLKDFISEIRAIRDVEQFVHQAELMLDFTEKNVMNIIKQMMIKVSLGIF